MKLDVAHITLPMPGELQNGDAVTVREGVSSLFLAVFDGLGHGPDAAQASRRAVEALSLMPFDVTVHDAMQELHRELRGTRGAAGTLCIIRELQLEICAVGNVALMCTDCAIPLVLSAGVLGHQVAKFRVGACKLPARSRIALLSDGVSTRFRLDEYARLEPERACQEIMARYRRKEDDATVLIADVRE